MHPTARCCWRMLATLSHLCARARSSQDVKRNEPLQAAAGQGAWERVLPLGSAHARAMHTARAASAP
eukprot:11735760-Alexandrium_andersonii.AAC.1